MKTKIFEVLLTLAMVAMTTYLVNLFVTILADELK